MNRFVIALAAFSLTCLAHAGDRINGAPFATRSQVLATHGMVATSVPLATRSPLPSMASVWRRSATSWLSAPACITRSDVLTQRAPLGSDPVAHQLPPEGASHEARCFD